MWKGPAVLSHSFFVSSKFISTKSSEWISTAAQYHEWSYAYGSVLISPGFDRLDVSSNDPTAVATLRIETVSRTGIRCRVSDILLDLLGFSLKHKSWIFQSFKDVCSYLQDVVLEFSRFLVACLAFYGHVWRTSKVECTPHCFSTENSSCPCFVCSVNVSITFSRTGVRVPL